MEAAEVYRTAGRDFIETVGKRFVDEVTKEDLEKYERRLRDPRQSCAGRRGSLRGRSML
jgi:hypothetical protein